MLTPLLARVRRAPSRNAAAIRRQMRAARRGRLAASRRQAPRRPRLVRSHTRGAGQRKEADPVLAPEAERLARAWADHSPPLWTSCTREADERISAAAEPHPARSAC